MSDLLKSVIVIVVIVTLGLVGYRVLFHQESAGPLFVQSVSGGVELIDREGHRSLATAGQGLRPMDRVETNEDGNAVLAFGETNTVSLQHATTIKVLEISPEGVRMELDGGRVEATVRPGKGSLDIVNRNREVVAENASFVVGVNADGTLAAESRDGTLRVYGLEGVAELPAGQRLVAARESPARVAPVSKSLLLEVTWPQDVRTREAEIAVRGRTDPGAMVQVRASDITTSVVADADGLFEASLPLREGPNPVEVLSEDPLGRKARDQTELTRDSQAPKGASFNIRY